jgi:tellurite resistance protein
MNKTLVAAAVLALSAFAASAAGAGTPRIDQRQANQEQRIDQGIASGELTKREAHRMNHQQAVINRAEDKAKADGAVSAQERKRLTKAQNKTSRRIVRQKHDAQDRPGS